MADNPLTGAAYLLKGAALIKTPGLRRYVILPLLINIAVFGILGWLGLSWLGGYLDEQIQRLPEWLQWIEWLVWPLLGLAFLVVGFTLFTFVAGIIAAPFNALLAETILRRAGALPDQAPERPWHAALTEAGVAVREETRKLLYFLKWALPFGVLFLIPGVNLIAAPAWLGFNAWLLAQEYLDYPLSARGLAFSRQRPLLRRYRWLALGFGGATQLATAIPLLNLLVIPSAVAGACLLWLEQFPKAEDDDSLPP